MATRKQKHQQAVAKRDAELAELQQECKQVLERDQARRRTQELRDWEDNHRKNHTSRDKRIVECPHCRIQTHEEKLQQKQLKKAASNPFSPVFLSPTA